MGRVFGAAARASGLLLALAPAASFSCGEGSLAPPLSGVDPGDADGSPATDGSAPLTPNRDASSPVGANPGDAAIADTAVADAGPLPLDAPPDAPLTLTVFPRVGSPDDDTASPHGPGSILMGGGVDVDAAFIWMHSAITAAPSGRGGDVVILRATGTNAYDAYIYGLAAFNSVQTLLIPPQAGPADLAFAAGIVSRAEAVFFAGGNQASYVAWNGSPLMAEVQHTYERGGVVGGTSAGYCLTSITNSH